MSRLDSPYGSLRVGSTPTNRCAVTPKTAESADRRQSPQTAEKDRRMPKNSAKTAETGTRPQTPDTQTEHPLNLNKDSTFRNGVINIDALTRWFEKAGIPQGEALQIAEGWIKVHKRYIR